MTIGLGKRFIGNLLNGLSYVALGIGYIINLIFMIKDGQTIGGKAMGYKYNEQGFMLLIKIWAGRIIYGILTTITFSIFFWVDLISLSKKNDAWWWEKLMGIKKIPA